MPDEVNAMAGAGPVELAENDLDEISGGPTAVEYAVMLAFSPSNENSQAGALKHPAFHKIAE